MSVFNYNTKVDAVDGLRRDVYNIKRTLKAMKLWVVNDVSLGVQKLRRRQVRPAPDSGSVFFGPWFDFINGVTGLDGVGAGGSTMTYGDYALGFTVSGAVVTVKAGKVRHGTRVAVSVAGTTVTVTDAVNVLWIYVAYTYGSTATILSSTTEPVSTETILYVPLQSWLLVGSTATLQAIRHIGDIILPSNFG